MASKRLATFLFLRASSRCPNAPPSCPFAPHIRTAVRRAPLPVGAIDLPRRWQSSQAGSRGSNSKIYGFENIQELVSKPSSDRILIDTREAGELQSTGKIPGSINIPMQSSPDAYFMSADEFEDRFGFAQPPKDTEVVFYCKAGVRSRAAAQLARQAGYERTGEYSGSWLDWEGRGGPIENV